MRQRPVDRGRARGQRLTADLCREAEEARASTNLTYASIGRALRISGWQVARILRGQSPEVSLVRLSEILAVLGLDLSARAFPAGEPLRDAAQLVLLERLRVRLGVGLTWRVEVPVLDAERGLLGARPLDLRAWDAVVGGPDWIVAVEAETRVRDVQALERRIALKARDGAIDTVLLLLSDTRHHRNILRAPNPSLHSMFPGSSRTALRRLAAGRKLDVSSIVVL